MAQSPDEADRTADEPNLRTCSETVGTSARMKMLLRGCPGAAKRIPPEAKRVVSLGLKELVTT